MVRIVKLWIVWNCNGKHDETKRSHGFVSEIGSGFQKLQLRSSLGSGTPFFFFFFFVFLIYNTTCVFILGILNSSCLFCYNLIGSNRFCLVTMVVGTFQSTFLTEQQQSAIAALSHVFSERPFPPNLSQDHQDNAVSAVSASASGSANDNNNSFQDYGSSTTLPLLLNTNQVERKNPFAIISFYFFFGFLHLPEFIFCCSFTSGLQILNPPWNQRLVLISDVCLNC